jgi:hypothetical protein
MEGAAGGVVFTRFFETSTSAYHIDYVEAAD